MQFVQRIEEIVAYIAKNACTSQTLLNVGYWWGESDLRKSSKLTKIPIRFAAATMKSISERLSKISRAFERVSLMRIYDRMMSTAPIMERTQVMPTTTRTLGRTPFGAPSRQYWTDPLLDSFADEAATPSHVFPISALASRPTMLCLTASPTNENSIVISPKFWLSPCSPLHRPWCKRGVDLSMKLLNSLLKVKRGGAAWLMYCKIAHDYCHTVQRRVVTTIIEVYDFPDGFTTQSQSNNCMIVWFWCRFNFSAISYNI